MGTSGLLLHNPTFEAVDSLLSEAVSVKPEV